jgi:hypothetical protein
VARMLLSAFPHTERLDPEHYPVTIEKPPPEGRLPIRIGLRYVTVKTPGLVAMPPGVVI